MCRVSSASGHAPTSSIASMELANTSLGQVTLGLRGTSTRQDVSVLKPDKKSVSIRTSDYTTYTEPKRQRTARVPFEPKW